MKNTIGVILSRVGDKPFGALCKNRPSYMLPFSGRYRLIDFSISNMVNFNIETIALYTGEKTRSVMDHIGDGKPWGLNRRFTGMHLFSPNYGDDPSKRTDQISQLYSSLPFYIDMREEYILIVDPNIIAKIDLDLMFEKFIDVDADITLAYKKRSESKGNYLNDHKIHLDHKGDLENIGLNLGTEDAFDQFLGVGLIKREALIKLVKTAHERRNASTLQEAILTQKENFKINFFEHTDYLESIRDLESYYQISMDLLDFDNYHRVFFEKGLVYTKSKDEPPTIYREDAMVENSVIANGCVIEGTVINSILFRGVKVGKGAVVKDSILMQKSVVCDNSMVKNTILDKKAVVADGVILSGSRNLPFVLSKEAFVGKD